MGRDEDAPHPMDAPSWTGAGLEFGITDISRPRAVSYGTYVYCRFSSRRGGRAVECGGLEIVKACSMGVHRHARSLRSLHGAALSCGERRGCWHQD
jgi:hypothetical protein